MEEKERIGILICDRYRRCAGGKCLRAMRNREGAFRIYKDKAFLEKRYGVRVVVGTHPIPNHYLDMHTHLGTWKDPAWAPRIEPTMADQATRARYE